MLFDREPHHPCKIILKMPYDNASQLTGMTYSLGTNIVGNLEYAYDLNGRRVSMSGSFAHTGIPNAVSTTVYANNQLATWGTANLFYDANGNMTSDGTHSYAWDARNRLSQIDGGATASFSYDSFGRRVSKNILGVSKNFLYDGSNIVQELSGTTPTANLLAGSLDEYFSRTDSSGARHSLTDALGSTIALSDSTGSLQTNYTFEPFGNTAVNGSATTNSLAYTGRELDATGLYFYCARYYNPMLSRFLSEDPIGFDGGVNLYGYVSQSPVNAVDPSGRQEATVIGAEAGCTLGPWGCAAGAAAGGAVDLGLSAAMTALFWKTVNALRRHKPKQCPTNNSDDLLKEMYRLMNEINGPSNRGARFQVVHGRWQVGRIPKQPLPKEARKALQ
jgi:RHS repeat-associated protein